MNRSIALLTVVLCPALSSAQETTEIEAEESGTWDSRGVLAFESRGFPDDNEPRTVDQGAGLFGRFELSYERGPWSGRARAFSRVDGYDEDRSLVVVEESWLQAKSSWLRLRAGIDIVNWTATEAFHPADVLNARNIDSDVENYEKIGEPMAVLALSLPTRTTLELYALPFIMEPVFTSPRSRLSFGAPGVATGAPLFADRDGEIRREHNDGTLDGDDVVPQGAAQIRQVIGSADLAVQLVYHTDRSEPIITIDPATGVASPLFLPVLHTGLTYQHVFDALIVKVEAAHRQFTMPDEGTVFTVYGPELPEWDHTTAALGLEYGMAHESGAESTFLLEGQSVFGVERNVRLALTPFQRDALVGYRYAFNDEQSREILLSGIVDLERDREFLVSASYGQRLGETWGLRLSVRIIESEATKAPAIGLDALKEADLVRLVLTRYF
jgi:hypothetical protein